MDKIIGALESGAVVLTATPQQAAHLREQYARHQQAVGRSAWTAPAVHVLSAWIAQVWEHSLLAGGLGSRQALLTAGQARWLWHQVLTEELEPAAPLLRLVAQAWRRLHDWDIDFAAVGRLGAGGEAASFHRWATRYRRRCADASWVDSVTAMQELGEELSRGAPWLPARLLFAGFETWQPGLARFAAQLKAGGCDAQSVHPKVAPTGPPRRREFPEASQEVRGLAAWAAAACDAGQQRIAIVLPELDDLGPGVQRAVLDLASPDWRLRSGRARPVAGGIRQHVADLGAVHVALLCLELCGERMDYQGLGQVLRSAYLAGDSAEADGRARLDAWLRERGERQWELDVVAKQATELAPELGRRLAAVRANRPTGARAPAAWVDWIARHLDRLGWPGKATPDADDEVGLRAWQDLQTELAACGLVTGELSFAAARALLADIARDTPVPADHAIVQLLRPAEALGQVFDGLWIAGLHGEAWPPAIRPNPLLPLALQRAAGVPDSAPATHAAQTRAVLQQLLQAAPQPLVSAAHRRGEERLTPASLPAEVLPAEEGELLGPQRPTLAERLQTVGETEVVADPVPVFAASERARGGARLLQLQAVCPARAFCELRLQARELPVPAFGIDAATRGQLTHAALERLYQLLGARGVHPGAAEARGHVAAAVEHSLAGRVPLTPLNRVLLGLEARRLASLLDTLLEFEAGRPSFQVLEHERGFEVNLGGLALELRADRIDRLDDGGELVIDYKTGGPKSPADWFGERPAEPQLPLYALRSEARAVAYLRLGEDGIRVDGVSAAPTGVPGIVPLDKAKHTELDDWQALIARWREVLTDLAREFAAGSCLIDADEPRLAAGLYAPLTRVFDGSAPR